MRSPTSEIAISSPDQVIDSRRLLYFYSVARLGSFKAAEAALDVAQSALTRQISQLESDLHTKLFIRHGRGVKLTQEGELLFSRSSEILRSMEETVNDIRITNSKPGGRVSIAAPPNFTERFMPEVLERILKRFPDAYVTAMEASSGGAHELLVSGRADIAVVIDSINASKLSRQALTSDDLFCICAPSHPAASKKAIQRSDWPEMRVVLSAAPNGMREIVDRYFRKNGIDVVPAIEADSLSLSKSLLANGTLCAILVKAACREELATGRLVAVPIVPNLARTLSVACLRDRKRTPLIEAMLEEVKAVVGDAAAEA